MSAEIELHADQIVAAAVDILRESGLDAVSMRSVAGRLGVTPPPVYARIGNKSALLDAVADHFLSDLAPPLQRDERWPDYARRWTAQLRQRLTEAADSRLFLQVKRPAYLEASRPLLKCMRRDGMDTDHAVRACRLLTWATVGFVAMDHPPASGTAGRRNRLAGSDPDGVSADEVDELFTAHIEYLIDGIRRDS
ncbi:TetR family transcriptional regulator [Mycobacterium sp. CVI_P3]|uniref:TetR family transcriptional regulator n=1 Tax=Mycobacterium pinniadriaticum TaxID=2994102 RepID=A0ABT3S7B5_9MYCO|nr:TetR family transcriptional regulator [Mycobacterium pinniadriaticum]MCX2928886.1 TetR family transcriptional regulator [Mycobacterium pinniadriaticum]MCX2935247.1 TetR family transcriptional regulator [Mycobacterium pinniadriaticum]